MFRFPKAALALSLLAVIASGCKGGGVETGGLRVSIEATPETGAFPLQVSLKATVNGQEPAADAEYDWNLGDGNASTDANPIHVFEELGTYEVTLTLKQNGKKGAASREIEVLEVGPGTDVTVEGVEATPSSINPGAQVNVKVTFRNRGVTGVDDNIINRVYLTTIEEDFEPFGTVANGVVNLQGIGGDETSDKSVNLTVPTSFAEGSYWIWVWADAGLAIDETNEENNVTRSTLPITITTETLDVDLVSSAPTLSGETFTPGTPVTLDAIIQNQGTADAGAFTALVVLSPDPEIDANDTVIETIEIGSLAAGADAPQSLAIDVPASIINRPWYLGIVLDTDSDVAETDEANNVAEYANLVTTAGGSGCTEDASEPNDVEAQATALTPGTLTALQVCGATTDWFTFDLGPGDRMTSVIDFQNVNGNLALAVFAEGSSTPIMSSNGSGNTETVNTGIALASGTYLLRVTLGAGGGNEYALTSTLEDAGGAGIDLVPTAIEIGPGSQPYAPGVAHTADVTVWNFGATATSAAFDLTLWLSSDATVGGGDVQLGTVSVPSLGSGMSFTDSRAITIPNGTAEGYYHFIAVADGANTNTETVETNNAFSRVLGVGVGCLDDAFEPNDTTATATAVDNGTYEMLQACSANSDYYAITTGAGGTIDVLVEFEHSDGDIDIELVDASGDEPNDCSSGTNDCYSAGTSDMEQVTYTAPSSGTWFVRVYGYNGAENSYKVTVSGSTGSIPDLSPNSFVATPVSAAAGEDVELEGRIKNNSSMASPSFEWQIRLSSDATIDASDATLVTVAENPLAANENRLVSEKVTLPDDIAGGNWYLGVVADAAGTVMESSESNNVAVVGPVSVTALCDDDGHEENDTLGSAAPIAIGGTISSLVVCSGDSDYYEIVPSSNGTLTIHADFVHANGDVDMRLFRQGTVSAVAASTSSNDDEDISHAVTAGTVYRLRVYGFNGAANAYSLTTSLAP